MNGLVGADELELSRTVYSIWAASEDQDSIRTGVGHDLTAGGVSIETLTENQIKANIREDQFLSRAMSKFQVSTNRVEYFDADWKGWNRVYRYARVRRDANMQVVSIVLLEHRADGAGWSLVVNLLYVLFAGAAVLAVLRPFVSLHKQSPPRSRFQLLHILLFSVS